MAKWHCNRSWKDRNGKVIGGVETFRDLSVVEQLRKELEDQYTFADIIARSAAMRRLLVVLPQFGESDRTVLIEGLVHPSTLFRKAKSLGIDMPEMDGRRKPS